MEGFAVQFVCSRVDQSSDRNLPGRWRVAGGRSLVVRGDRIVAAKSRMPKATGSRQNPEWSAT